MATQKKVQAVETLQGTFSKVTIGILTDYRGMTTTELNDLRHKLRAAKVEYKVVKNTLAVIAARNAGLKHVDEIFKGPSAMVTGYGEISEAARALTDYIRTNKSAMKIRGGFLTDTVLTAQDVDTLAKLPTKSVLISQVMAGMQTPISRLVSVLAAPIRDVMGVLQARIKQMEAK
jgi:large subunit ribosomal protein L10